MGILDVSLVIEDSKYFDMLSNNVYSVDPIILKNWKVGPD